MKSLYAQYLKERQGIETIEKKWGFVSYSIQGDLCFVEDLFITKDNRSSSKATELMDLITVIGRSKGCTKLGAGICPYSNGWLLSMKCLQHYNMTFSHSNNDTNMMYFKKEI